MRITIVIYLTVCTLAALIPFLPIKPAFRENAIIFPGWPKQFEHSNLKKLPLSEREEQLAKAFSGHIARFTDGEREIIMRWTTQVSRKLPPASDCFRRLGYVFRDEPFWKAIYKDQHGMYWGSFETARPEELRVLERIHDETEQSWTDMSSWYWAVLLGKTKGPWWIITIVE